MALRRVNWSSGLYQPEGDAITSSLRPRFPGRSIGTARFTFRRDAPLGHVTFRGTRHEPREKPIPMLSRVADSIYWMSRYIERAENVARFIDVNLNLMLDAPDGSARQWEPLVNTTGDYKDFAERCGEATQQYDIHFLTFYSVYSNSII